MPYTDVEGQCSFTRKAGEAIMDPEHYVCKCKGCDKEVTGKVHNRARSSIAAKHSWVQLQCKTAEYLYCSVSCARAHDQESVEYYKEQLRVKVYAQLAIVRMWEGKSTSDVR